jgi:hypothetical protein
MPRARVGRAIREDAMAETFHGYRRLIWERVYEFTGKYGTRYGTPDELYSAMMLVFVRLYDRYDRRHSRFTTFLRRRVDGSLQEIRRDHETRLARKPLAYRESETIDAHAAKVDTFRELLADLSDDACEVIRLTVDGPRDLAAIMNVERNTPRVVRRTLIDYLHGLGWTAERVKQTLDEIREAMT